MLTDLETWLHDEGEDMVFDVYVKKHIYTPYEQDKKFSDEMTEDLELSNVIIKECIVLPDKDVLMGFYWYTEDDSESNIYYYKLSEIRLVKVDYGE